MKKIFGKIDNRRDEKENEKAHSSFIGKKFIVGKHPVVVEVNFWWIVVDSNISLFLGCDS